MTDEPRTPGETPADPGAEGRPLGRAAFLGLLAGGAATLLFGQRISGLIGRATGPVTSATGLDQLVPTSGWRIYTVASTMPSFDPQTWRLRIDGLVERPLEISYPQLLGLPVAEQRSDFHCVTGWTVRRVRWRGVRFADLLSAARPREGAGALRFISAERPYEDSLDLRQAGLPDVMLAYEMDGRPLTRAHGAPVRVVIPDMYGYKNVKWVERIEVVARAAPGYWEQRGYDTDAWVGRSNGYGA